MRKKVAVIMGSDSDLADRLTRFKSDMAQEVAQKDQKMQREEF